MSTTTATVGKFSGEASNGRDSDMQGRATTVPVRDPPAAGTKLGVGTDGGRGRSGGGGVGPKEGVEVTMAQYPVKEEGPGEPLEALGSNSRR